MKILVLSGLFFSSSLFAANLFVPYYGEYQITEIECSLNGEIQPICLEWKRIEIKSDPIVKERVCILTKKMNSTSADCYQESNVVSDENQRVGTFSKVQDGVRFDLSIVIPNLQRTYEMEIVKEGKDYIFKRSDVTFFPTYGQTTKALMEMKLKKIR